MARELVAGDPRVAGASRARGFSLSDRLLSVAAPVLAALVAFVVILPTVMPTVANWDTAEFQTVGPVLGTAHPTGFPSYVVLGWLASIVLQPFGEVAYRMNLLEAILAAVAVGATTAIVQLLTGQRFVAFAAGLLLATTQLFWGLSTHADPHMFHAALLALVFALLLVWEARHRSGAGAGDEDDVEAGDEGRGPSGSPAAGGRPPAGGATGLLGRSSAVPERRPDRWLVAATVVYGIAVANHSLALLLAPGIGLFVLAVEPGILTRPRLFFGCAAILAAVVVGFFLELPIRAAMHAPLVYGHPDTWEGFRYVVLAEQFHGLIQDPFGNLGDKAVTVMTAYMRPQLGVAELLFAVGFVAVLLRRPVQALVAGGLVVLACALVAPQYFSLDPGSIVDGRFWFPLGLATVIVVRPRYALLSGVSIVITLWFSSSYNDGAIDRYYLGPLVIAMTWAGIAAAEAVRTAAAIGSAIGGMLTGAGGRDVELLRGFFGGRGELRAFLAGRVVPGDEHAIAAAPAAVAGAGGGGLDALAGSDAQIDPVEATRARRREIRFVLQPVVAALLVASSIGLVVDRQAPPGTPGSANESQRTGDRAWLDQVMAGLPKNAAIVSWWSYSTILWYGQKVEGMRPDIFIADDRTRLDMGLVQDVPVGIEYFRAQGRPVFLIRPGNEITAISRQYTLQAWFGGSMYQVIGPLGSTK